jgi:hypothetical protein
MPAFLKKTVSFFILLLGGSTLVLAQNGSWTWMSGQNTDPGVVDYGTLQVASPTNTPGTRRVYAHWEDLQGDFWLYGGFTTGTSSGPQTGIMGDMWKYDPTTTEWTWMAGSSVPFSAISFTAQCVPGNGIPQSVYENRINWRDQSGWDGIYQGEIAKGDVYVYKLSYSNICTGEQVIDKLGHVTLIR